MANWHWTDQIEMPESSRIYVSLHGMYSTTRPSLRSQLKAIVRKILEKQGDFDKFMTNSMPQHQFDKFMETHVC